MDGRALPSFPGVGSISASLVFQGLRFLTCLLQLRPKQQLHTPALMPPGQGLPVITSLLIPLCCALALRFVSCLALRFVSCFALRFVSCFALRFVSCPCVELCVLSLR